MDNQSITKQDTVSEISVNCPKDFNSQAFSHPLLQLVIAIFFSLFTFPFFANYLEKNPDKSLNIFFIFIIVSIVIFALLYLYNGKQKVKNITINPLGITVKKYIGGLESVLWQDMENVFILMTGNREYNQKTPIPVQMIARPYEEIHGKKMENIYRIEELYIELNNNKTKTYKIFCNIDDGDENNLLNILQFYLNKHQIQSKEYNLLNELIIAKKGNIFSKLFLFILIFIGALLLMALALMMLALMIEYIQKKNMAVIFVMIVELFIVSLFIYSVKILRIKLNNLLKK